MSNIVEYEGITYNKWDCKRPHSIKLPCSGWHYENIYSSQTIVCVTRGYSKLINELESILAIENLLTDPNIYNKRR